MDEHGGLALDAAGGGHPAIGYLVGAYLIPESPRYLIATHKVPEARKVLTRILGERNLEISVNRIQESLDRETKPSIKDIRGAVAGLKPIVWVGIALAIFQQFRRHQRGVLLLQHPVAVGGLLRIPVLTSSP